MRAEQQDPTGLLRPSDCERRASGDALVRIAEQTRKLALPSERPLMLQGDDLLAHWNRADSGAKKQ